MRERGEERAREREGGRGGGLHHIVHGLVRGERVELRDIGPAERDFFIDNLVVRIFLIIEMILVDRPCAIGV